MEDYWRVRRSNSTWLSRQTLSFHQHLMSCPIAVIVLHARSNRLADLGPLVPGLLTALRGPLRGAVRIDALDRN
jgi:hypothetical protein